MTAEYYQFSDGRVIQDERISELMFKIADEQPEMKNRANSTGYSWDEAGLSELFAICYKEETCYCPEYKSWYTYFQGKWQKDTGALLVSGKIKEFTRALTLYANDISDDETRKRYTAFVAKLGDRRIRDRLMKDAETEMLMNAVKFDSHPNLINCINGTFDVETMEFRDHNWADFLTMQTNVNSGLDYSNFRSKRWETFINEITEGNAEKADYLQRALGYSILGTSKEECMFILYGKTTRNGKSTLLNTIQHLLGDYASVAPVELICKTTRQKDPNAASPTLAKLKGKRFVTMSENENSGKLDESIIKQYTGGEEITARGLWEQTISFLPQFTMWLSCNDLPAVRDKSLFASDRLKVIEMNRHFGEDEQNKDLKSIFTTPEEMKGIFTWLIAGCMKYKQKGLTMNEEMKGVIKQYAKDNDLILQFLEEKCVRNNSESVLGKTLYDNYKSWCRMNGYFVCNKKKFHAEVTAHPEWYSQKTLYKNNPVYQGLKLEDV